MGTPCKMNSVFSASSPFENEWRIHKLHASLLQIGFQYFTSQENVAKLGRYSNVSFSLCSLKTIFLYFMSSHKPLGG